MLFGAAVFLSAFLLFLIQPLLGKFILPWFGGTPAVWTTCMFFYQAALLAGYAYAHSAATRIGLRRQVLLHVTLMALSLALLPILPSGHWKPEPGDDPVVRILGLLVASAGVPYLVLAATSPLLQAWYARARHGLSPYRLYALANAGSLLAVIGYPFVIEPAIGLRKQALIWSIGYAVAAGLIGICALKTLRTPDSADIRYACTAGLMDASTKPSAGDRILWIAFAACGSLALLATTNQLCLDVAVVPLLWVLPLSIYLLSFVLCFHSARWYSRTLYIPLLAAGFGWICHILDRGVYADLRLQIASYAGVLFLTCMVCHGELIRLKPAPAHLTSFYLAVAAGGAVGGALAASVAPGFFRGYWEYHVSLLATVVLLSITLFRDPTSRMHEGRSPWSWALLAVGSMALAVALFLHVEESMRGTIAQVRNFFGVLRVVDYAGDDPEERHYTLMHGRIEHGSQYLSAERRYWPTSYFGPDSGVGLAIRCHPRRALNRSGSRNLSIGVVGLGTGTIATYGEEGDRIRFYEINPAVLRLSEEYFTYRSDSAASVDVVLGDARLEMERECSRGERGTFDILAIDAFSSDAIPVHLLTSECFQIYRRLLKKDGVMALHISNRYFSLSPVVRGQTLQGEQAIRVYSIGNELQGTDDSEWVLLSGNRMFLENPEVRRAATEWPRNQPPSVTWTDDYSNLFRLFHPREP